MYGDPTSCPRYTAFLFLADCDEVGAIPRTRILMSIHFEPRWCNEMVSC